MAPRLEARQARVRREPIAMLAMSLGSRYTCADDVRRVAVFYGSTGTVDDQAWGALWLHKATQDQSWLDKVRPWTHGSACFAADMPGRPDIAGPHLAAGHKSAVQEPVCHQHLALVLQARPGCTCSGEQYKHRAACADCATMLIERVHAATTTWRWARSCCMRRPRPTASRRRRSRSTSPVKSWAMCSSPATSQKVRWNQSNASA